MDADSLKEIKLVYLISHGHTARGAFQTGLLEKLNSLGEVHVITKKGTTNSIEKAVHNTHISIHNFSFKIGRWDQQRSMLRMHVHQDIRQNPALWEKHLRRSKDKNTSLRRRRVNHFYYYLGAFIRWVPGGRNAFSWWEARSNHKSQAQALLKKIQPDYIISTRPVDEMEIYLLEAARRLGIHKVFYILSWDNITSKGIFPVQADSYLTWGPIMNEELKEYYQVSESQIYNTGVTHFDVHAGVNDGNIKAPENLLYSIGLKDDRPYLFFTMSASYYAPNEIDIIEYLSKQVEENQFGENMQLVVRPHMANLMADRSDRSWLERLKHLDSKRVKVDFPDSDNSLLTWYMKQDDMLRLSALLKGAAVCLNSGSTISIEAVYQDRPVVLTPFDTENWPYWQSARRLMDYIHLKKFAATGACTVVSSLNDMTDSIHRYLKTPELHQKERKKAVELECYRNDGKATERFVKNIQKIHQLV